MGNEAYFIKHGHSPQTCTCLGCCINRGERPAKPTRSRKRNARNRNYLWLDDETDGRVRIAAAFKDWSLAQVVRVGLLRLLDDIEAEITTAILREEGKKR